MSPDQYIWVNKWDEFQSFQKKRGKPWAPPWVKLYTRILDEPAYLDLTPETRSLLVGLWALFGRSRGTVTKDTRRLTQQLHQRVTKAQLESLNHGGWITFCSGTVLEHKRNAFWNSSALEVEVEVEVEEDIEPKAVTSTYTVEHELDETNGPGPHDIQELQAQTTASIRSL